MKPKLLNKILIGITLILHCQQIYSQTQSNLGIGYNSISTSDIKFLIEFFASDELAGRNTGSVELSIAEKFLISQYKLAGLTPVPGKNSMVQEFSLIHSRKLNTTSFTVFNKKDNSSSKFAYMEDFVMASDHAKQLNISAPLIFAGYSYKDESKNYNDFNGIDVKGKIVFSLVEPPPVADTPKGPFGILRLLKKRASMAQEAGAIGIIFIGESYFQLGITKFRDLVNQPKAWLDEPDAAIPLIIGGYKLGDAIVVGSGFTSSQEFIEQFKEDGLSGTSQIKNIIGQFDLELDLNTIKTNNIIAYLEGSDPILKDEVVIVGAHYDHLGTSDSGAIFNGADDNASGNMAILEIANAFSKDKIKPKRSLLFISFSAEELGKLGSIHYVENPFIPLDKTTAMFNLDMIGRNSIDSIFIVGSNFLSNEFHQIIEDSFTKENFKIDYTFNSVEHPDRIYFRSDNYSFGIKNIPNVQITSGHHNDYHQATDTIDKINFEKIAKISKSLYKAIKETANLNHKLKSDGILVKN